MNNQHSLIDALAKSKVYQEYERAFTRSDRPASQFAPG